MYCTCTKFAAHTYSSSVVKFPKRTASRDYICFKMVPMDSSKQHRYRSKNLKVKLVNTYICIPAKEYKEILERKAKSRLQQKSAMEPVVESS